MTRSLTEEQQVCLPRPVAGWVRGVLATLCALTLLVPGVPLSTAQGAPPDTDTDPAAVAPDLQQQVAESEGERVQALLMLPNLTDFAATERVPEQLQRHADETQAEVALHLEQDAGLADVEVLNGLWITNAMVIEFTADQAQLGSLAQLPGVDRVIPNFELTAPEPEPAGQENTPQIVEDRTWGLDRIEAHRVWEELGVTGEGVRVATLDSGVDITHPDLAGTMVTDDPADPTYPGGWMEFTASGGLVDSVPRASTAHGTHVAGTIHGGDASGVHIGVAPDAEMMHGLVLPGGSGSFAQVAAGMQWAIVPTDSDGDPAGEPADVVNMSLGAPGYFTEMIAPTQAMRAAGVVPAFAIGNENAFGNCGVGTPIGSSSPGNVWDAIGVGATDVNDDVAEFSCGEVVQTAADWGAAAPDYWPDTYVTPDLSAPGANVYSSVPGGSYARYNGTSMATPHLAGTAALMLAAAPDLGVDLIEDTLRDTSFFDDRHGQERPNTRFGEGRINAYEAVSLVAIDSGIQGTVTDTAGEPVAGATVTAQGPDRSTTTAEDGSYTVRVEPGTYDVTVTAFGYQPATVTGVVVVAEEFTTADVTVAASPTGDIRGTVTLTESGQGIPGVRVSLLDVPVDLSAVTDGNGDYLIEDVPVGNWQVQASHPQLGEPPPVTVTVIADQTSTVDFAFDLPPDTVAVVGDYAEQYQELLATYGIAADVFEWEQIEQTYDYPAIVTGYGLAGDFTQESFDAFLAATDASGAGVVFTDQGFGAGNGIRQLSRFTGFPESTGFSTSSSGATTTEYLVTQEHPILEGFAVGDEVTLDNGGGSRWIAWFDGYADGDTREVLADMTRSGTTFGEGIGAQQRAMNRHALLSSHGVSVTTDPVTDWDEEGKQVFLNAIDWVAPERSPDDPFFVLSNLTVAPDVVLSDEPVTVSVDVTNVGGSTGDHTAVLQVGGEVEDETTVTLDPGETQTVSWTVTREDLGTYEVSVGYLSDSFRVRAPIVDLTAWTVDAPDGPDPTPLAGATVQLIDDGELVPLGTTDEQGEVSFEIPDPIGEYTVVVHHQDGPDDGVGESYLLHREMTIIGDDDIVFAPRLLAGPAPAQVGLDFVTRVDLAVEPVAEGHAAMSYLRAAHTAPFGFGFAPGEVVVTLDVYELVNVHEVTQLEQDWVLPSEIIGGLEWVDPYDATLQFGGDARASIEDVDVSGAPDVVVDWQVTDAYGHPFATVLATDVRPFVDLPDAVELEDIEGLLAGDAPNEELPILRLFDPQGDQVRAGSVPWDDDPFTLTLGQDAPDGEWTVRLEVDTGAYSGDLDDEAVFRLGEPDPEPEPEVTTRLAGANRYATSVRIGEEAYPDADTVVLVSGEDRSRVDGLVAGPLGRALGAPVLLTGSEQLPDVVVADLTERGVQEVTLVGGEGAVKPAVVQELSAMGITTERVFGRDRWATAAAVAEEVGGEEEAVVASGRDPVLVDALGASGPAARVGSPILLVDRDAIPSATAQALEGYSSTVVVGGTTVVGTGVFDALPDPVRVSGPDRYATAVAVAGHYAGRGVDASSVSIASGSEVNMVDALPGGSLGQLTLLTGPEPTLRPRTATWLQGSLETTHAHILGGPMAVSDEVVTEVEAILEPR